jgi:hypothetical protein
MVIEFASIPIIWPLPFFGCLTTDALAGLCVLICRTYSNELFLVVILFLSYLLASLNFSLKLFTCKSCSLLTHMGPWAYLYGGVLLSTPLHNCSNFTTFAKCICTSCK